MLSAVLPSHPPDALMPPLYVLLRYDSSDGVGDGERSAGTRHCSTASGTISGIAAIYSRVEAGGIKMLPLPAPPSLPSSHHKTTIYWYSPPDSIIDPA